MFDKFESPSAVPLPKKAGQPEIVQKLEQLLRAAKQLADANNINFTDLVARIDRQQSYETAPTMPPASDVSPFGNPEESKRGGLPF